MHGGADFARASLRGCAGPGLSHSQVPARASAWTRGVAACTKGGGLGPMASCPGRTDRGAGGICERSLVDEGSTRRGQAWGPSIGPDTLPMQSLDAFEAPAWPAYHPRTDPYLRLESPVTAGEGVRTEQCDFWDRLSGGGPSVASAPAGGHCELRSDESSRNEAPARDLSGPGRRSRNHHRSIERDRARAHESLARARVWGRRYVPACHDVHAPSVPEAGARRRGRRSGRNRPARGHRGTGALRAGRPPGQQRGHLHPQALRDVRGRRSRSADLDEHHRLLPHDACRGPPHARAFSRPRRQHLDIARHAADPRSARCPSDADQGRHRGGDSLLGHPIERIASVREIAEALQFLEAATFVTGEVVHVDGGAHAGKW